MVSVIIVAGGDGQRFGGTIPKQFIKIHNKEMIDYSIEKFLDNGNIDELIIVSPKDWVDHIGKRYPNSKVVAGGLTRSESVINGLSKLSNQSEKVLIHDAARPLIDDETISMCIEELNSHDCVAPMINVKESTIVTDRETYNHIDRNKIKIVQTPQCFKTAVINDLYNTYVNSSDEIGLALKSDKNYKIKFIPGSEQNIKVTMDSDLEIIKLLLKNRDSIH